jgi:hypothetical protein
LNLYKSRPIVVCLCPYFPQETIKLNKNIKIGIFQHPFEVSDYIIILVGTWNQASG